MAATGANPLHTHTEKMAFHYHDRHFFVLQRSSALALETPMYNIAKDTNINVKATAGRLTGGRRTNSNGATRAIHAHVSDSC